MIKDVILSLRQRVLGKPSESGPQRRVGEAGVGKAL